jgi:hypothetical protein
MMAAVNRVLDGATKQDRALRKSLMFCAVVLAFAGIGSLI